MPLVTSKRMLADAQKGRYAVPAFNIENMEMVQAVLEVATELDSPVILQTTPSTVKYAGIDMLKAIAYDAAKACSIPVALHLDHGDSYDLAVKALRTSYTSIMIDGSKLQFDENIAITRKVVEEEEIKRVKTPLNKSKIIGGRKMKRFIQITCVLLVFLMLAGCAKPAPAAAVPEAPAATEAPKEIVVGVSLLTREHVFYNNIETALNEKAKELGIKLIVQDAAMDANKQLSQVQDFVTQKVNAIILCPTNSAGSKSMVELANKANIPVFTMDISSDGETTAHVATDNYKGGELAAEYVGKNMLPEGKGEVAIVTYSEVESCVNREKGFIDYLAKNYPDIKVVDVQNSSGDQAKSADVTQNMLLKYPNLKVIFGVGDPFAMGALSAVKSANKKVQIIGFDGNPEGINEIKSGGLWIADVAQDPAAIGAKTLEAVKDKLDGKEVPKNIPIAPKIIDKSNL